MVYHFTTKMKQLADPAALFWSILFFIPKNLVFQPFEPVKASMRGYAHIVRLLATARADLDAPSGDGSTALLQAAYVGSVDDRRRAPCATVVALLLELGADAKAKDCWGKTAVTWVQCEGWTFFSENWWDLFFWEQFFVILVDSWLPTLRVILYLGQQCFSIVVWTWGRLLLERARVGVSHWCRGPCNLPIPGLSSQLPRAPQRLPLPHRALRRGGVPRQGVSAAQARRARKATAVAKGQLGLGRLAWRGLWMWPTLSVPRWQWGWPLCDMGRWGDWNTSSQECGCGGRLLHCNKQSVKWKSERLRAKSEVVNPRIGGKDCQQDCFKA